MPNSSSGWRIVGIGLAGLLIGIIAGGLVGFAVGYVYVSSGGWGVDPATSTVAPLRESIAAFSGFVGFIVGAIGFGVTGATIGAVFAYIKPPAKPAP